jgi:hypothetical protein
MKPLRIFISSVQKEFAEERATLRDYLRGDPLLRRFVEPFLFEETPAADRRGQPESRPESQPESLEWCVLGLLSRRPLSKSELSSRLGQKVVSGHLNQVIRILQAEVRRKDGQV